MESLDIGKEIHAQGFTRNIQNQYQLFAKELRVELFQETQQVQS